MDGIYRRLCMEMVEHYHCTNGAEQYEYCVAPLTGRKQIIALLILLKLFILR